MLPIPSTEIIQFLQSTLLTAEVDPTDAQLLECFVSRGDSGALEALVRRHAAMVWGVCRRVLGNHHDAEDAFQATFLVLVRRAASVHPQSRVGNWLHGVAHQTALKARSLKAKRQQRERSLPEMPGSDTTQRDVWDDLQPLLDQEISRLPEKYRAVIVWCELEGKTLREAVRQLGCPEGTVASRLARARAMLAKRLGRHDLVTFGGVLAGMLLQKVASARVPPPLVSSTIEVTTRVATGLATTEVTSVKIAALTQGVVKSMLLNKLKLGTVALVMILALIVVGGLGITTLPVCGQSKKEGDESKRFFAAPAKDDRQNTKQGRIYYLQRNRAGEEVSLAAVGPDGKGSVTLTKNLKPEFFAVSPDGRQVVYGVGEVNEDNREYELFLKAADDDKPGESLKVNVGRCCWSPDGHSLAITNLRHVAGTQLLVFSHAIFDFKTKKTTPLQLPGISIPGTVPQGHIITDWSKDGKWLLTTYWTADLKCYLYRVKSDGSEGERIGAGGEGKFSPDGKKVLYSGSRDDDTPEIEKLFIVDVDGVKPQQISKEKNGEIGCYSWSPDGKKIVYVWQDHESKWRNYQESRESFLIVMDADGKNRTVILSNKQTGKDGYVPFSHPDWRP